MANVSYPNNREREKELKKLYEETSSIHVEMETLFEMIKDYIQIPPYNENFIHECPEDRCMTRSLEDIKPFLHPQVNIGFKMH